MKARYIFKIIALVAGEALSPWFAWAQEVQVSVSPPLQSVQQNADPVSVSVNVTDVTGLQGSEVVFSFDNTLLEFRAVTNGLVYTGGSDITEAIVTTEGSTDIVTVNQAAMGGTANGSGALFSVAFRTKAQVGTTSIHLISSDLRNELNQPIGSTRTDGSITVNDVTPPTVTNVSSTIDDGAYGVGAVIAVTVTFSEAVTVTDIPQLTLETGAIDAVVNYMSGSGTTILTFDYAVAAGHASGDLDYVATTALTLNGGAIKDGAGNDAVLTLAAPGTTGSLGANKSIVIDTAPPTAPAMVDLEPASDTGPFSDDNITSDNTPTFDISLVESNSTVTVYGNGDVLGTVNVPLGHILGTFTPTSPMSDGTYVITATQTDAAGNVSSASAPMMSSLIIDTAPPTVTVNQALGQADPTGVSPINFIVVFSEEVTGFASEDVTIGGTAGGTKTVVVTGNGATYNVSVGGMTNGSVTATLGADVAHDAAGNVNQASTTSDNTVTFSVMNLYVGESAAATAGALICPNENWVKPVPPSGYPVPNPEHDWGYTGTQQMSIHLAQGVGSVFNNCSLTLSWAADMLEYSGTDFGTTDPHALYGSGQSYSPNPSAPYDPANPDHVTITCLRGPGNFNTLSGDYIAKVNFTVKNPGYSKIQVAGQIFQLDPSGSIEVAPHEAEVKMYLGDVANSATDQSHADGVLDLNDLNIWAESYWSGTPGCAHGMEYYKMKFDVGPTFTRYINSLPAHAVGGAIGPDGKIDFEDLIIFSITYGQYKLGGLPKFASPPKDPVIVSLAKPVLVGNETRIPVMVEGAVEDIRGMKLEVNGQFGAFLGVEKGQLLQGYTTPVTVMSRADARQVYVDVAVMGLDAQSVNREGELIVLRFEGTPYVHLSKSEARNSANTALQIIMKKGEGELAPTTYNLAQNYPNPFNPTTTIGYALPQTSQVTLDVYNVLGEKVATLVDEVQEAGFYQLQWNGKDIDQKQVASGIYLCRIRSGEFRSVKKMLMLK